MAIGGLGKQPNPSGHVGGDDLVVERAQVMLIIHEDACGYPLDDLLFKSVIMVSLVFAIAIPFFMVKPDSLPLTLGIFPGINYIIVGWIMRHWIGYFHAVGRTALVTVAWFLLAEHPHLRFVVIPAVVVGIYAVTIYVMATRRPST